MQKKGRTNHSRSRLKPGENFRLLREWAESNAENPMTIREISKRTKLAYSSVQQDLKKAGSGWRREDDNRWRFARDAKGRVS